MQASRRWARVRSDLDVLNVGRRIHVDRVFAEPAPTPGSEDKTSVSRGQSPREPAEHSAPPSPRSARSRLTNADVDELSRRLSGSSLGRPGLHLSNTERSRARKMQRREQPPWAGCWPRPRRRVYSSNSNGGASSGDDEPSVGPSASQGRHNRSKGRHLPASGGTAGEVDWELVHSQDLSRKPWFVVLPHAPLRRLWDVVTGLFLIYVALVLPVIVCFQLDVDDGPLAALEWVLDVVFIADVPINFVTAYVDPRTKLTVLEPPDIARHYLRGWFLVDAVASVPFQRIRISDDDEYTRLGRFAKLPRFLRVLRLLRLLRLLRVLRVQNYLRRVELKYRVRTGVSRVLRAVVYIVLVTHFTSCLWHLIAVNQDGSFDESSWVYRADLSDADAVTVYIAAVSWSVSTVTTVGDGAISAGNDGERLFAALLMIVGVTWYAFVVSSISSVVAMLDRRRQLVDQKLDNLNEFSRSARLPADLAARVRAYLSYAYEERELPAAADAEAVLQDLSLQLRCEVMMHIDRALIDKIPFLDDKTPQFISTFMPMLQPLFAVPNELIMKQGSHADEMYFLTIGRAAVLREREPEEPPVEIAQIEAGMFFGEAGCMLSSKREFSVQALTICELYSLSKANLRRVMTDYPDVGAELKHQSINILSRDFGIGTEAAMKLRAKLKGMVGGDALAPPDGDLTSPRAVPGGGAGAGAGGGHSSSGMEARLNSRIDKIETQLGEVLSLLHGRAV